MNINVGFDFGTHQTKICIEDRADKRRPKYTFFKFKDLEGKQRIVLPSVIQINDDDTLSYGFVDSKRCKCGIKNSIGKRPEFSMEEPKLELPEEPQKPKMPSKPMQKILDWKDKLLALRMNRDVDPEMSNWRKDCELVETNYKIKIQAWENKCDQLKIQFNKDYEHYLQCKKNYENAENRWLSKANVAPLIYRYFKQASFADYAWPFAIEASYLCIWFIANILFDLNDNYGNTYSTQIGIPTGDEHSKRKKEKAISIFLTAFDLVENVFKGNKQKFLSTKWNDLKQLTRWQPYSEKLKDEYGLSVFPEAYASLLALTTKGRLNSGMNLMVDIGGGTTDISFFVVSSDPKVTTPLIYHYQSLSKGINYIMEKVTDSKTDRMANHKSLDNKGINSYLLNKSKDEYFKDVKSLCRELIAKLYKEFAETGRSVLDLNKSLSNRPIVYTGGGSTFHNMQRQILCFSDITQTTTDSWFGMYVPEKNDIAESNLGPILSVALGLSVKQLSDDIKLYKLKDLFAEMKLEKQMNNLLGVQEYLLFDD